MKKITKKARIEKAREIIDRNLMDVPFSADDWDEFRSVTGIEADGAIRRVNPSYPTTDPRHVRFIINGEEVPISWRKSIEGRDPKKDLTAAMRLAVSPCLREYRDAVDPACNHCGSADYPTVDHVWPPFDHIMQEFIDTCGPVELKNEQNGIGHVIADINVEADWVAFHASRASYQILCRSCNASKGKTKSVRKSKDA